MERLSGGKHWARADAVHRDGEEIFVSSKAKKEFSVQMERTRAANYNIRTHTTHKIAIKF